MPTKTTTGGLIVVGAFRPAASQEDNYSHISNGHVIFTLLLLLSADDDDDDDGERSGGECVG